MNACTPTNRSFCVKQKPVSKPRSDEALRRLAFFQNHDIEVESNSETGTASIKVTKKNTL